MTRRSIVLPATLGVVATVSAIAIGVRMFHDPYRSTQLGRFFPLWVCLWVAFSASLRAIGTWFARAPLPAALSLVVAVAGGPVGCFGAARTFVAAQEHGVRRVAVQLEPLTRRLREGGPTFEDAIPTPPPAGLRVLRSGADFVVEVDGGSVDIDGSTIFYDSTRGRWDQLHHDEHAWKEHQARTESFTQIFPPVVPSSGF